MIRNPRLPCQVLPTIDLTLWKDNQQNCNINGQTVAVGESHLPSPCTSCICTPEGVSIFNKYLHHKNVCINIFFFFVSQIVHH